MSEFVEFKEYKGDKILVNIEHIVKVLPDNENSYIYLDVVIGNNGSTSPSLIHVEESYSAIKRKLKQ